MVVHLIVVYWNIYHLLWSLCNLVLQRECFHDVLQIEVVIDYIRILSVGMTPEGG